MRPPLMHDSVWFPNMVLKHLCVQLALPSTSDYLDQLRSVNQKKRMKAFQPLID